MTRSAAGRPPCSALPRRRSLANVVQRYGADINGGAELHARYVAEHLSSHADIRVLTTCARNYLTWSNELPPGPTSVNGITVERFPVTRERPADLIEFGRQSNKVFHQRHSLDDELVWFDEEGPVTPALLNRLATAGDEFDFVIAFSLRYPTAFHAARLASAKTVLVPTMEREAAMGLSLLPPVLRGVRAIMYNSYEERWQLQSLANNAHVPGVVVGIGSDIPPDPRPDRAREKFGLTRPFILYVGRIDANKGCDELFALFLSYLRISYLKLQDRELDLVLIGTPVLPLPDHPGIRHLGFVSDADKFDVLAAAEALVMPSYYESLSMVALEAWALGRPVLANAHCDVLLGQCLRSNAGLFYRNADEFAGALDTLLDNPALAGTLGANGRRYFADHYRWSVIEGKYLEMLSRLAAGAPAGAMEPLPDRQERRRRDKPPAADVVAALPAGPAPAEQASGIAV
jgi:glycosyltransferase involved in cell wall biosynthesis